MTAANHVLAGAIIGTVIREPALALPIALLSHFVMDILPHFGFKDWEDRASNKKLLNFILVTDGLLLLGVVVWLLIASPYWLVLVCGLTAASPDLVWVYRFTVKEKFGRLKPPPGNWLTNFHSNIQKLEFKQGIIIEYVVFVVLVWTLSGRI